MKSHITERLILRKSSFTIVLPQFPSPSIFILGSFGFVDSRYLALEDKLNQQNKNEDFLRLVRGLLLQEKTNKKNKNKR